MNDDKVEKNDVTIGARQLVIDTVLRVMFKQASSHRPEVGDEIAEAVISYCRTLDPQSEVEVEFVRMAKAYLGSLLHPAHPSQRG